VLQGISRFDIARLPSKIEVAASATSGRQTVEPTSADGVRFRLQLFAAVRLAVHTQQGACMFPTALERLAVLGWFGIGLQELLIIAFIVLILFGSRLPSVMRSLGQGVVEFKKGVQGVEDDKEAPRRDG
jgi:sec-independent protein translocase protein TatA